ncbi:MAG: plastocyanin/azurin family copper-binding protein [Planctomycetota bacterium]
MISLALGCVLAQWMCLFPAGGALVRVGAQRLENGFDPRRVEIAAGETVKWVSIDDFHTVTSGLRSSCADAKVLFDAAIHIGQPIVARQFPHAGRYHYYCVPHERHRMTGIVDVSGLSLLGTPKAGSVVQWQVRDLPPESNGKLARILLTASGSSPGVPLFCLGELPLQPDLWTDFSIRHPGIFTTGVITGGTAVTPPLTLPGWIPAGWTIVSTALVQDPSTGLPERILPALTSVTQ